MCKTTFNGMFCVGIRNALVLIALTVLLVSDQQLIKRVIAETSSGALLANDCLVHFTVSALPFGGVGEWTAVHLTCSR